MGDAIEAELLFRVIDIDGSGSLDVAEFHYRLSDQGLTDVEIQNLFMAMDKDGDSAISLEEFTAGYRKLQARISCQSLGTS